MVSEVRVDWKLCAAYCTVLFAVQGFFIYLIMNFINGIPRELDEAAKIDGCSYYGIFTSFIIDTNCDNFYYISEISG